MCVLNETIYILPTKSTATNESLRSSEFTGLKRIKNLRQRNHESGTYLMVSRILFKVLQVLFKTSSKCFLPDKIIVIAALFVKHDNAFYHIWGSRVSVFSVIEIIFAILYPLIDFKTSFIPTVKNTLSRSKRVWFYYAFRILFALYPTSRLDSNPHFTSYIPPNRHVGPVTSFQSSEWIFEWLHVGIVVSSFLF